MYISFFTDLKLSAQRSSVQTVALLNEKVVKKVGLKECLEATTDGYGVLEDLRNLVVNGYYDEKTGRMLQVRIVCSLGDNLEQNEGDYRTNKFPA